MVLTIKPKVTVVDWGPRTTLVNGQDITPDESVWGASRITYKDIGAVEELRQAREEEKDISATVKKSLIRSAGSGHASMATTPGMWIMLEGNCSKMVDSAFTGYRFASSLMPSGRRIPIALDQIVIPEYLMGGQTEEAKADEEREMHMPVVPVSIAKRKEARELYMQVSEANIEAYELLQTKGVPKEEAAKIVQYGHRGGGFMFMPLETIIALVRNVKRHGEDYPTEITEIALQLENFARSDEKTDEYTRSLAGGFREQLRKLKKDLETRGLNADDFESYGDLTSLYDRLARNVDKKVGLKIVYEARMAAPRTGCVNPNIFHSEINEAQEAVDANLGDVLHSPILQEISFRNSPVLEKRVRAWLEKRERVLSSTEGIIGEGAGLVHELHDIVEGYNNSFRALIAANIPWRVWGEDKRHRTMPLTTESIYHAVERAGKVVREFENFEGCIDFDINFSDEFLGVVSIPPQVAADKTNLGLWLERFGKSVNAYNELIRMGVPKGDALNVVPRGLKVGVSETLDLYNATTGHNSLRLCKTAEREKRETTEAYRNLLLNSNVPDYIRALFLPKCNYVGFCFEEKPCGRINAAVKHYNPDMHATISKARAEAIISRIR